MKLPIVFKDDSEEVISEKCGEAREALKTHVFFDFRINKWRSLLGPEVFDFDGNAEAA